MNIHVDLESVAPSKPGHMQETRTVPSEVEDEPAEEEREDSGSTTRS